MFVAPFAAVRRKIITFSRKFGLDSRRVFKLSRHLAALQVRARARFGDDMQVFRVRNKRSSSKSTKRPRSRAECESRGEGCSRVSGERGAESFPSAVLVTGRKRTRDDAARRKRKEIWMSDGAESHARHTFLRKEFSFATLERGGNLWRKRLIYAFRGGISVGKLFVFPV